MVNASRCNGSNMNTACSQLPSDTKSSLTSDFKEMQNSLAFQLAAARFTKNDDRLAAARYARAMNALSQRGYVPCECVETPTILHMPYYSSVPGTILLTSFRLYNYVYRGGHYKQKPKNIVAVIRGSLAQRVRSLDFFIGAKLRSDRQENDTIYV